MAYPQIGISFASVQHLKGLGLEFKDNFSDGSIFWAWRCEYLGEQQGLIEEGGLLKVFLTGVNQNYYWGKEYEGNGCPKVFVGVPGYPCEIIAKLSALTLAVNTQSGLFISALPRSLNEFNYMGIVRRKEADFDGVCVVLHGERVAWLSQDDITTLPLWLKIRIGNFSDGSSHIIFSYSIDGVNWLPAVGEEWIDYDSADELYSMNLSAGLFSSNYFIRPGDKNNCAGHFDSFKIKVISKD